MSDINEILNSWNDENIVEPDQLERSWDEGQRPPAQWQNWFHRKAVIERIADIARAVFVGVAESEGHLIAPLRVGGRALMQGEALNGGAELYIAFNAEWNGTEWVRIDNTEPNPALIGLGLDHNNFAGIAAGDVTGGFSMLRAASFNNEIITWERESLNIGAATEDTEAIIKATFDVHSAIHNAGGTAELDATALANMSAAADANTGAVRNASGQIVVADATADNQSPTLNQAGKIVQLFSETRTSTYSESVEGGGSTADVIDIDITPKFADSQLYIHAEAEGSSTAADGNFSITLTQNGSAIDELIGNAAGDRNRSSAGYNTPPQMARIQHLSASGTIQLATTSTVKIGVQGNNFGSSGSQTIYFNRAQDDPDSKARSRSVTTLTVMEVRS